MKRKPDIIFLERRTQRIKRHWKGMSRIGRLGVISIVFASIGLVTSWLFFLLQYLSVPFSLVGLVIGLIATVLGLINNEKWYGFWLPVVGLVVAGIGLATAAMNYNNRLAWELEQNKRDNPAALLVGLWEQQGTEYPTYLNFTDNGNVLMTRMLEKGSQVQGLFYRQPFQASPNTSDRLAGFAVRENQLSLQFRSQGRAARCDFQYHLANERRLIIDNSLTDCREFQIVGTWQLLSRQPESSKVKRELDEKLEQYQSQLSGLENQRVALQETLDELKLERNSVLAKLAPYENGQQRDDSWKVHARELKTITDKIDVIESRLPQMEMTIVRMESMVRNRIREAQMAKLGLSDEELEKLLRIKIEVDDELASAAQTGPVEDLELQTLIEEEMAKKKE